MSLYKLISELSSFSKGRYSSRKVSRPRGLLFYVIIAANRGKNLNLYFFSIES